MGGYDEALGILEEEIRVASAHDDWSYLDYLLGLKERLPNVYEAMTEDYGELTAEELIYLFTNEAILHIREFVRGITKKPRFYYAPKREILKYIVDWSRKRGYKFGINREYIARNIGTCDVVIHKAVETLKREGLIFFKKRHGRTYVLPTKKGRALIYPEEEKTKTRTGTKRIKRRGRRKRVKR